MNCLWSILRFWKIHRGWRNIRINKTEKSPYKFGCICVVKGTSPKSVVAFHYQWTMFWECWWSNTNSKTASTSFLLCCECMNQRVSSDLPATQFSECSPTALYLYAEMFLPIKVGSCSLLNGTTSSTSTYFPLLCFRIRAKNWWVLSLNLAVLVFMRGWNLQPFAKLLRY